VHSSKLAKNGSKIIAGSSVEMLERSKNGA